MQQGQWVNNGGAWGRYFRGAHGSGGETCGKQRLHEEVQAVYQAQQEACVG